MRLSLALIVSVLALVALPAPAEASPYARYGVQDDAWLAAGPGTLDDRLDELSLLGVEVYRFTLRWDQVERRNNVYDWSWPYVDLLIHIMVRDDSNPGGWQSGLRNLSGETKPVYNAFRLPLAQVARHGTRTTVWGQVRPRSGRQPYRLQQWRSGGWRWIGSQRFTGTHGFYSRTIRAGQGARLRVWSPRDGVFSPVIAVR